MKIARKRNPYLVDDMNVQPFFYWINERHRIYLNRKQGKPWPWTEDEFLQNYRWCNVFRELDKVTLWIRNNWTKPFKNHDNLWFAMAVARQINLPETLAEIQEKTGFPEEPWNPRATSKVMKDRRKRGSPVFTGSYIITGTFGGDKVDQVCFKMLSPLWKDREAWMAVLGEKETTLESVHKLLTTYGGFGRFMAYEVVSDWRWTRYLSKAADIYTWANPGPGAVRGLMRLMGRAMSANTKTIEKPPSVQECVQRMRRLLEVSPRFLEPHVPGPLEMRDIEHSLCETDKYLRVQDGGHLRNKYIDPTKGNVP